MTYQEEINSGSEIQEVQRNNPPPRFPPHGPPHGPHGGFMREEQMTYQEEMHSQQPPQPMIYGEEQNNIQEIDRKRPPGLPPHGPHGIGINMREEQFSYQEQNISENPRMRIPPPIMPPHGPHGPHGGFVTQEQYLVEKEETSNYFVKNGMNIPPPYQEGMQVEQNEYSSQEMSNPPQLMSQGQEINSSETYMEQTQGYMNSSMGNYPPEVKRPPPPIPHGAFPPEVKRPPPPMPHGSFPPEVKRPPPPMPHGAFPPEVKRPPPPMPHGAFPPEVKRPPPPMAHGGYIPPPVPVAPHMNVSSQNMPNQSKKFTDAKNFIQMSFLNRNKPKVTSSAPSQPMKLMNTGKLKNMVASMNQHFQQGSAEVDDEPIQIIEGDAEYSDAPPPPPPPPPVVPNLNTSNAPRRNQGYSNRGYY